MQKRDRRRPEPGYRFKSGIDRAVIEGVMRPDGLPRALHLEMNLKGSDAVLAGKVRDLTDVLFGAHDRREKKIDER